ncbi:MAG: hypothetical protein GXZ01_01500 [Clostridiaceae bacterium]|nr:hypothetical protein [Clostridiaceae bacterium]
MENLRLTNEIRQAFDSVKLPEIDVSDSVMNSIENTKIRSRKSRNLFAAGVAAAVLLLTTGAYAAVKIWFLNDSNNNTVLEYRQYDEENGEPFDVSEELIDQLLEDIEPGKALIYYDPELITFASSSVLDAARTYSKPVEFTELDMLVETAGFDFTVPSEIPEGYAFAEGQLTYRPLHLTGEILRKLREEAETNGKNFATAEWETTSEVLGVNLVYRNKDKEFRIHITVFDGVEVYTDFQNKLIEKMTLKGRDILYIEEEGARKIVMRETMPYSRRIAEFAENGKAVRKEINSYIHYTLLSGDLTRDELLNVAESMIP